MRGYARVGERERERECVLFVCEESMRGVHERVVLVLEECMRGVRGIYDCLYT
jgi:hypothetical protein